MASLFPQFNKLNQKYNLVSDGQKILIAVSGGIDSLVMCRLLSESKWARFAALELQAVHVRLEPVALSPEALTKIKELLTKWKIPFEIINGTIASESEFDCYACARERRKQLFRFATDNHYDSLAFGHHLDDYLETGLLNLLFNGSLESLRPVQTMLAEQIRVIRPLLTISKKHIRAYGRANQIEPALANCPFAIENKREDIRKAIRTFSRINPAFRGNLRRAINLWNQLGI